LHKRHNALLFHHVCEAIASGYIVLTHLPWKFNPMDILSKHRGYQTIWQSSSLSCSSMEIQQTSFKMTILFRYSSYRNYLLRYMCINFLGNRPQADGEWQKLHSHAYTCAMVCSFVSFTYYLVYLRRWIAKKIRFRHCLLHHSFPSHSW
jgi:hypothetical protein